MAESLIIDSGSKEDKYRTLLPQIAAVTQHEPDPIANMANVAAMIHSTFRFWWTGFYRVSNDGATLVLGPLQGPLACTRIPKGRGVCGTAWLEQSTQVVGNVELFPGHIACSSSSKSEIVVPVKAGDRIVAVLDIDSEHLDTFDDTDRAWLEQIAELIAPAIS